MNSKTVWLALAGVFVVVAVIIGISRFMTLGPNAQVQAVKSTNAQTEAQSVANANSSKAAKVMVGGVLRPATDVKLKVSEVKGTKPNQEEAEKLAYPYGKQPLIDPSANPNVASVYEALKEKTHPERLSPFIQPAAFDPKIYAENPQKYLDVIEPGRVWQSAQPGPGIPVLASVSSTRQIMKQGEAVRLSVKTIAGQPVTFTSFDLGAFDNQLNSISVAANELGVAEATFTAPPGTIAGVSILAASPAASGNVRFVVDVRPSSF